MKNTLLILISVCIYSGISAQSASETDASADSSGAIGIDSSGWYGFIREKPVKVGGGPAEQRKYLERLRDGQGKRITYVRSGSCCAYKTDSPKAFFGSGMLDVYQVTYRDADNKKKKVDVYITFYDFEEPQAIKGFTLVE